MSFIQCKSRNEVEATLKGKAAFVTEDFRIYDKIEFWDDAASTELDPDEVDAILTIKHHVEMLKDPMNEMAFTDLLDCAKRFEKMFKEQIKKLGMENADRRRKNKACGTASAETSLS